MGGVNEYATRIVLNTSWAHINMLFTGISINNGCCLSYDYKFDIEDDQHKISCMCGAPNCRKWMN
ncbi:hypothetical protein NQ317_009486 [Molorchus minor]|uniref:Post-SET domain-containing protein n=1 Tax=Molorchus minor TaxID=1323400 RepID=A0ABQ9JJZ2_9CUCU|nr:hypothetical protein NQ317_009486 [Molorchus minor]